jgi:hypothetical protein
MRGSIVATFALALVLPAGVTAQGQPTTKSPDTALLVSFVGTLGPIAVNRPWGLFAGLVFGPNLGDLYGGDPGRAAKQTAIRVGVVGITAGAALAVCGDGCSPLSDDAGADAAAFMIIAGTALTGILAGREIIGVRHRVEARNERARPRLGVAPMIDPNGRGVGLSLNLSF